MNITLYSTKPSVYALGRVLGGHVIPPLSLPAASTRTKSPMFSALPTLYHLPFLSHQSFSDPDLSTTSSTRATGAAGVLLLLTFIYCLGYPVLKALRRARTGASGDRMGVLEDGVVHGSDADDEDDNRVSTPRTLP